MSDNKVEKILKAIKEQLEIRIHFRNKPPNYTLKLKKTETAGFFPIALAPLIAKAALAGLVSYGTQKVAKLILGLGKSSIVNARTKAQKKKEDCIKIGRPLGNKRKLLECDNVSNHDIVKQLNHGYDVEGVFALDEINHILRGCGVINFDKSNKKGFHWLCYLNDRSLNSIEYFDSFGKIYDIPIEIVKFLKRSKKKIKYNDSVLQQFDSLKCGCFFIYYIKERNKGKKPL